MNLQKPRPPAELRVQRTLSVSAQTWVPQVSILRPGKARLHPSCRDPQFHNHPCSVILRTRAFGPPRRGVSGSKDLLLSLSAAPIRTNLGAPCLPILETW